MVGTLRNSIGNHARGSWDVVSKGKVTSTWRHKLYVTIAAIAPLFITLATQSMII